MDKTVKVGIVGLGAIGKTHASAYKAVEGVEVVAVCDVLPERVKALGDELGVSGRYADYHELLQHPDLDAVSICVGNALHRDTAIAALGAGKHILLEKPMAMNAAEAEEIKIAGERAGRVIQVGMVRRQHTACRLVRERILAGDFGEIYHMRAVMIRRRGIPGLGGWFTNRAESGGGPMIDLGVHWFDVAMYVSGLWNPTRVSAMTHARFGSHMRNYRYVGMWAGPPKFDGVFDVEDYSTGLIRFGDKASMSFEIAWAANTQNESYVEILGDKAGVRLFDNKPTTLLTENREQIADIQLQSADDGNPFQLQAKTFRDACLGVAPPAATAEQGVTVMKTIDAVYASCEQNQEIVID